MAWKRTHTCGELRESHIGQTVTLNGWVHAHRAFPDQVFVDLRDRYGLTQVVFEGDKLAEDADNLGREFCISVRGKVRSRLPGKHNPNLVTGDIEVEALELQILNRCPTPPFEVTEFPGEELANEDLRLQYRYLDLRRPTLHRTLATRHRMNKVIRDFLDKERFLELETPLLGRSTPEGARDYLVPSRVNRDEANKPFWYALPQSPQIYKQLLMVAGYDRYFQIARCLRDEDLRADRQPEFTQLDLEMSFVEMDDVLGVIDQLTAEVFQKCLDETITLPLPRLSYDEAWAKYGSDKPDLRINGMEIVDVSDLAQQTDFQVFRATLEAGGKVACIKADKPHEKFLTRKNLDSLAQIVQRYGAKGLAWAVVEEDKLRSPIEKFIPAAVQQDLRKKMAAGQGDLLLFVADNKAAVVWEALGHLRADIAGRVGACDYSKRQFKITWIFDFPSFIRDEEENRWAANHHPFTAPRDEDLPKLESDPGSVKAKAYDLVINGYECGGGSIRIHNPEVQARLFKVLGMTQEQAKQRFGFLLDALSYGAPPHGGIALGLDRLAMLLAWGKEPTDKPLNIRDVIAFPKNQKARDLMTGAPTPVDAKQLKELGL